MGNNIRHFRELDAYRMAMESAVGIFEMISHPEQWTIRAIHEEGAEYA